MKKGIATLICCLLLLTGWQLLSWKLQMPSLVPGVPELIKSLYQLLVSGSFYQSVAATLVRGLSGMLISLGAALLVAFIFSKFNRLYELLHPLLAIMRSVPVISFILLALIFMHPESIPLLIAFLTMFPLLTENLTKGLCSQRKMLRVMGLQFHISRYNRFTQLLYPQLKPFLFSGLASAMGFGWRAIIMGEVLAQCQWGIGGEMKRAQSYIAVPELLAWTLIAILISYTFDRFILHLQHYSFPIRFQRVDQTALLQQKREKKQDITVQDLSFRYEDHTLFSHFNYCFSFGKSYGIKGPSGQGKTTLLYLISGLLTPKEGTIFPSFKQGLAVVFQEPELVQSLSAVENVALPLSSYYTRNTALLLAHKMLDRMDLHGLADRQPDALSYGQQQRVAIARALAFPASLLLMDEPFKGLDNAVCKRIIDVIRELQEEKQQTLLFSSHSADELQQLADIVLDLSEE